MRYDPERRHRQSLRLRGFDYAQPGAYFVTICTQGRVCAFGDIEGGEMRLNSVGRIVEEAWDELPSRFPGTELDERMVMPNHVHGIIVLDGPESSARPGTLADDTGESARVVGAAGAIHRAHTVRGGAPKAAEGDRSRVGEIVRAFKALAARRVRLNGATEFAWQRNYYEHVIRSEGSLCLIREYIVNNAALWAEDRENPAYVRAGRKAPPPQPRTT